jgi:hypothetical protein
MRTITPEQEHALRCACEVCETDIVDDCREATSEHMEAVEKLQAALKAAGYLQPARAPAPPPWDQGAKPAEALPDGELHPAAMGMGSMKTETPTSKGE